MKMQIPQGVIKIHGIGRQYIQRVKCGLLLYQLTNLVVKTRTQIYVMHKCISQIINFLPLYHQLKALMWYFARRAT